MHLGVYARLYMCLCAYADVDNVECVCACMLVRVFEYVCRCRVYLRGCVSKEACVARTVTCMHHVTV